jgi:hypothetical protein
VALAADYYACIIAYIIVAASLHDVVRSLFVGQPASKSQQAATDDFTQARSGEVDLLALLKQPLDLGVRFGMEVGCLFCSGARWLPPFA